MWRGVQDFGLNKMRGISQVAETKYEACPESKDTKVLNMYNIFNLQKRHCEWITCA
jgi:hypothetical protein